MKSPHKIAALVLALGLAGLAQAQSCGSGGGTTVCLNASGTSSNVQLGWTVSGALSGLQVYRNTSSDPNGRQRIAQLPVSERSYVDTTAAVGTRYWYWVKFTTTAGSYNSGAADAQAGATAPPPTVSGVVSTTADFSAPASPRMNQRAYYRVTGSKLTSTTALEVADCMSMRLVSSSSSELRFSCMPSFSEGSKAIAVKAASGGTTVYSSWISVGPATTPLPMPTAGFNLGNTFESTWGYPDPTQAVFTNAAKAGFNAVRIPCAWNFNSVDGPGGTKTGQIKAAYMAKVKQSVDWALAAGLHVMINIHWDGGWFENNIGDTVDPAIDARLKYIWQQIATEFAGYDNRVLFAAANEPNAGSVTKTKTLFAYYKTFIDTVRAAGGKNTNRWLVLQGTDPSWFTLPADPTPGRLMMEYHNYTPSLFTIIHSDQSWGKAIYYWGRAYHYAGDPTRNATNWEEGTIDSEMQHLKEAFVDKGVPVLIGEMQAAPTPGLTGDAKTWNKASTLYWNKYVAESAQGHGLSPFYWSTPNSPFDYGTGAILDQPVVSALTGGTASPPPNGAPMAVTGLVAKAAGSSQVNLSWNAVPGATSYRLYRSAESGYQPEVAAVSGISGTSYSDVGLNAGTTYYYKVVAANASGISGDSPEAYASTSGTNPDPAKFNFETDTQRWSYSGGQITGIATSTAQKYAGQRSLAVSFSASAAGSSSLDLSDLTVPAGATITFRVWAPAGHTISSIVPFMQDYNWGWTQSWSGSPAANSWSTVTLQVPANAVSPLKRLSLQFNTGGAWAGTVYVDSISVAAP
jgi:aryl-phospho-beta-D-glucosidase BglC (GH1 family)